MPSATENSGKSAGMSEAHLLVPWYAAGTLDESGARELEKLAKEDQELAKLIAEAKLEFEADVAVNEALGAPSPSVWRRIETSIEQEKLARRSAGLAERARSLSASISGFLASFTIPQWQAVAAVAVALCVIQAGAFIYLLGGGHAPPHYQTASGAQAPGTAKHAAFIVSFSEDASIGDVSKALDEAGAVIIEGPNADMLYHIGLRDDKLEAKDQAYAKFRSSGLFKLILPEK
jgi:hypothetical protein